MLVGDANDFQEYVHNYYKLASGLTSADLRKISAENEAAHGELLAEKAQLAAAVQPFVVTVSGAEAPITYALANELISAFGVQQDIALRLYASDSAASDESLRGLRMELEDLASDNLRSVRVVRSAREAFEGADFVILLDRLKNGWDLPSFLVTLLGFCFF